MRFRQFAALALFPGVVGIASAGESLIWDNYPGGTFHGTIGLTSERNTSFVETTWSVDDVNVTDDVSTSDVRISRIEWVGMRDPNWTYSDIEVILMDSGLDEGAPNTVLHSGLNWTSTPVMPDPNPDPLRQVYTGSVTFDEPISPPDLHFYIGIRLVGDSTFRGRALWNAHSADTSLQGLTGGFTKAVQLGAPFFRPSSDVLYGTVGSPNNVEFAFRVYGEVPEPATLTLIGLSGMLLAARRR